MAEKNEADTAQEDILVLLKQYEPVEKLNAERDSVAGRYRILTQQPLHDLSSAFAKAYEARDDKSNASLYALVFDKTATLRQKNIITLKDYRHPHMVSLIADGISTIGTLSESRYVIILEKPNGKPIAQLMGQGNSALSEPMLIEHILRPIVEILLNFSAMGISHGRINLNNVYIGNGGVVLGECVSEPSGYSQPYIFEPADRLTALPGAKNDFSIHADCYALGILIMHLVLGHSPFPNDNKTLFIEELLSKGAYHTLATRWDIPDGLLDLFRALLNDARRERWTPQNLESWLSGRKFNLIMPSQTREATRAMEFRGANYFNRRSLAEAMFLYWDEAQILLDEKLVRWVDTGMNKGDTPEIIARIIPSSGDSSARSERAVNDMVARVIIALDPTGPIRLKHISTAIEGIGPLLAQAALSGQTKDQQILLQMIESDLPGFWQEQQKTATDQNAALWKLQKSRAYLRMAALGFGIERCLYELNSGLACQSPMLASYYVTDIVSLLYALDRLAVQKAGKDDCIDRHIAGFIASKLEITKEIHIHELDRIPGMSMHPTLVTLKLLTRAQQKAGNPTLKGLSYWMSLQLFPLLVMLHRRSLRQKLQDKLRDAAGGGSLQTLADIVLNPDIFVADYNGFQTTSHLYAQRGKEINELKNKTSISKHSRVAGRGIAQTVAYTICLATVYIALKAHMHF